MPKKTLDHLITQLHEAIGDDQPSPQVAQLIHDMERQVNRWNPPAPEDGLKLAAENLVTALEAEHPQAVAVARKIMAALVDIGI